MNQWIHIRSLFVADGILYELYFAILLFDIMQMLCKYVYCLF